LPFEIEFSSIPLYLLVEDSPQFPSTLWGEASFPNFPLPFGERARVRGN